MRRFFQLLDQLDEWLLGRFDDFVGWAYKKVGLDSIHWCRGCCYYALGIFTIEVIKDIKVTIAPFSYLIMLYCILMVLNDLKDKRTPMGQAISLNIHRYSWKFTRMLLTFFVPVEIVRSLIDLHPSGGLAYILAIYFLAAQDLPPGKSKLAEWIESFSRVPDPVET